MIKNYKLIVSVLAGVIVACVLYARSVAPPPSVDKIADTWVGYTEDDLNFYRLILTSDGKGLCAFTFVREPAVLYEVTGWSLSRYQIEISLKPIDAKAEPIHLRGETAGWHLDLRVSGKGWGRDIKMYREPEVKSAHERTEQRMADHINQQSGE